MTSPSYYRGLPVSEGVAAGELYSGEHQAELTATAEEVADAFSAVARERAAFAEKLRAQGRDSEAEIVAIGAVIAADPALSGPAVAAVRDGTSANDAIERAAAGAAAAIAALPSPELAERAADVLQVGSAVLDHLAGGHKRPHPGHSFILVRHEVDPAELIRLADAGLVGVVSVTGGASSHAAIIARGLGLPMLAGADPAVLAAPAGHRALLDAGAGQLVVDPPAGAVAAGSGRASTDRNYAVLPRSLSPSRTRDGAEVTVLCNVASAAETRLGLAAGAAGAGLVRTEIPFVSARGWPSQATHHAQLIPVLSQLMGKKAVVRLLDFSGDKIPPFLAGGQAGLTALLSHPTALRDQLRAVLLAGRGTKLSVMVPMVTSLSEVSQARTALETAAAETGTAVPSLGIMVEVPGTAAAAAHFAPAAGFFSIGTNDLTSQVLGLDRGDPRARPALAADPRVLSLIAEVSRTGREAGIDVSVCGDAAADPTVLPLLLGVGIRTFSVGAAKVADVTGWIAGLDLSECAGQAAAALRASSAEQVWAQVRG
jgi:multiphosphoryl transfer protein